MLLIDNGKHERLKETIARCDGDTLYHIVPLINHDPSPDPSPSGFPRCRASRSRSASHLRDGPASHPSRLATLGLEEPCRIGGLVV